MRAIGLHLSNWEICVELGDRFKKRRKHLGYSQELVSKQAGISKFTISQFENGKGQGLSLTNLVALFRSISAIDELQFLLQELPESPMIVFEKQQKRKKSGAKL